MTSPGTHEHSINVALGEVLRGMRRGWRVLAEQSRALDGGGRADMLVLDESGWPVAIEAERANHASADADAIARLGRRPVDSQHAIETAIALVYPDAFQRLSDAELRDAIRATDALEYALHTHVADDERGHTRLPQSGWLRGSVIDLAMLVHRAATPAQRIEALADALAEGVDAAAELFPFPFGGERGNALADVLGQTDDEDGQTRRMAMTVLLNAFVFHAALAQAGFRVRADGAERAVRPVDGFWDGPAFRRRELTDEWAAILDRNYWPIFESARKMLAASADPDAEVANMPAETAGLIASRLWRTANRLVQGGVTRSHDLTGTVFQRLIADRKFLATFYTRPEAAALLAGLALPVDRPPGGADWGNAKTLARVQIGDFACGTGTLLSAAYSRLSLLHELHGGDPKALHGPMMAHGLFGMDVLLSAVHLTATMLAGTHPDAPFDGERLLTMPYGAQDDGSAAIGSLELMPATIQSRLIGQAIARTAGARDESYVADFVNHVGHGKFDLVIMNPPFTRPGGQEGEKVGSGNPAFAAFNTTRAMQSAMQKRLRMVSGRERLGTGNAGLAAHFADLAMRKLRPGGTLALVLPLSAVSGISWEAVRQALRNRFGSVTVLTISAASGNEASFSADTGMAECLFIGSDYRPHRAGNRGTFIVLRKQAPSMPWAHVVGSELDQTIKSGYIRSLEGGYEGATPIRIGNELVAFAIDCPLPSEGPWKMVGIGDTVLAQVAYGLEHGGLAILGSPAAEPMPIPIAQIGDISGRGPYHMDIYWDKDDGSPQGPFRLVMPATSAAPTYPMLWAHDTKKERYLIVAPDSEGQIKSVDARFDQQAVNEKAAHVWSSASRAHYNRDHTWNAQSLVVAMTERPCIGGRAWPSVIFENPDHEYAFALWSNSTLGFLLHWWTANKTQAGRGMSSVTGIPRIPTLDVRALSEAQHARAREAFEALRGERFLPFDQIDEDDARARLDYALLVDVLGLPESLCATGGPLETLRRKLAAEPQVHGGKRTRVVFTPDGERTERRTDR